MTFDYLTTSHQDKIEILELIYKHKPGLVINSSAYVNRYYLDSFYKFPCLRIVSSGMIEGYYYNNELDFLSREEFLMKLGIKTEPHTSNKLQFKFI